MHRCLLSWHACCWLTHVASCLSSEQFELGLQNCEGSLATFGATLPLPTAKVFAAALKKGRTCGSAETTAIDTWRHYRLDRFQVHPH
jgi:hypothetical protein